MQYETPRLYTREMTLADTPDIVKMLQDKAVMYAYEHAFSTKEIEDWMSRQFTRYEELGFGLWTLVRKDTHEIIGQCGLTMQDIGDREVLEIGYLLQKEHWHKGYATEAAIGCKEYAFSVVQAREVFSIIRDTNYSSMNVAIRNGMLVRGQIIKHYHGMEMPHYLFSVRR